MGEFRQARLDAMPEGAATLLGIGQTKVSRITRGQFRGVSEAKLLELVAKQGHDVKIVVSPVRRRAGMIELQFARARPAARGAAQSPRRWLRPEKTLAGIDPSEMKTALTTDI